MARRYYLLGLVLAVALLAAAIFPSLALAAGGQALLTRFRGEIEVLPEVLPEALPEDGLIGDWTVAGRTVTVTAETAVDQSRGAAEVGAQVQVLAIDSEGNGLVAVIVHVLPGGQPARTTHIRGIVEELGNTPEEGEPYMVVKEQQIMLTGETQYEGEGGLTVGATVKVTARIEDGIMYALRVQFRQREARYVPLNGTVESIEELSGLWWWTIVDDEGEEKIVLVTEDTELRGDPGVGDQVRGQARVEDEDTLVAIIIAVWQEPQPEEIRFEGPIQRFPEDLLGRWMIGGQFVIVDEETEISGAEPQIGAMAAVIGLRYGNGNIHASSILVSEVVEDISFEATIIRLPSTSSLTGQWIVEMADGSLRKVQVLPSTTIIGEPAVGAGVLVTAEPRGRQTWMASEVEVPAAPADESDEPDQPDEGKPKKPPKPDKPGRPK